MKTKTLSILLALVAILSMSVGVFAADFTETWDEETVLTVFSDMEIFFPDLFVDANSDFLWSNEDMEVIPNLPEPKAVTLDDVELEAKAPVDVNSLDVKASIDPCGDGLYKIDVEFKRDGNESGWEAIGLEYGPKKTTYIRDLTVTAKYDGFNQKLSIAKCTSSGGDNCRSVKFNSKGVAKMTIYAYAEEVISEQTDLPGQGIEVALTFSNTFSALFDKPSWTATGTAAYPADFTLDSKKDYCQLSLKPYSISSKLPAVRAKYDQNTGEARFQATIANEGGKKNSAFHSRFVIPAEIIFPMWDGSTWEYSHVKDYTCKYTIYNNANGAPRTDYCKYGEGIALTENALIRFDISLNIPSKVLRFYDEADIPFNFRVGGMDKFVTDFFKPVDFPCPKVTRLSVMDPLKPFMTFYGMEKDDAIEASGAYGVYEGGLWGIYQKCGKYAYMAVRLKNDGMKDEVINLDHVAVAVNGGTPMSWNWVLSTIDADGSKIELPAGEDVILIGRAKVTDVPSQLNADTAMTGAVNFTDYGFYITGKVYSDHNNTNCVAAPK